MKFNSSTCSLVIAGAWNPYVLQPLWVLSRIPGARPGEEQPVTTEFALGSVDTPRFVFPNVLKYQVLKTSLTMAPENFNADGFDLVSATARNIVRDLAHTPVTGLGYNFQFDADDATSAADQIRTAQDDIVTALPDDYAVVSNAIRTSLTRGKLLLNVSKEFQGGTLSLKFNFHYAATSTAMVGGLIEEFPMRSAYDESLRLAREIFDEELNDD